MSLFERLSSFFTPTTTTELENNNTQQNVDSSEEESDPEKEVKELYGISTTTTKIKTEKKIVKNKQIESNNDLKKKKLKKGIILPLNKDFDLSKFSKIAISLKYEQTYVEKQAEVEEEFNRWKNRQPTYEEEMLNEKLKTNTKFIDNGDYGFYGDLAQTKETNRASDSDEEEESSEISSLNKKKEKVKIQYVDVPFTFYATIYNSFGICLGTCSSKNGFQSSLPEQRVKKLKKKLNGNNNNNEEDSLVEDEVLEESNSSGTPTTPSPVVGSNIPYKSFFFSKPEIKLESTTNSKESDGSTTTSSGNNNNNNASEEEGKGKNQIQLESIIFSLKDNIKDERMISVNEDLIYYLIFEVEFNDPESFLKQKIIQSSKGSKFGIFKRKKNEQLTIIKSEPFSNSMLLTIHDISKVKNIPSLQNTFNPLQYSENIEEICRFKVELNNTKNVGKQQLGVLHYKNSGTSENNQQLKKYIWNFRKSFEFRPIPPKKLFIKLESVENIPVFEDVYISLWFMNKKNKTKAMKSKSPKFNETYEYDISNIYKDTDKLFYILQDRIKILLKQKKAFQKEEQRLISECLLPTLSQLFSGSNCYFSFGFPPTVTYNYNTDIPPTSSFTERKKTALLHYVNEERMTVQGEDSAMKVKVGVVLAW
ncbi:hypothetical protein ABK040_016118 [Willaertia magna]